MKTRFKKHGQAARTALQWVSLPALWLAASLSARAQAVAVTLSLDTNTLIVGSSTVLHINAQIVREPGLTRQVRLSFTPCSGDDHYLEFKPDLRPTTPWQPVAGGPHNAGSAVVPADQTQRFFRVRSVRQTGGPGDA